MFTYFEFTWKNSYIYIILQAVLMSSRMEINFRGEKEKKYKIKKIMFDLITECCLSFLIIVYLINKRKKNSIFQETKNKTIIKNYNDISYIKDIKKRRRKPHHFGLILISSFNKFYFSIFNYYFSLKYFKNDYLITTTVLFNLFFIIDVMILALIKIYILKRKLFRHKIVAIAGLIILIFPISVVYSELYDIKFQFDLRHITYYLQFFLMLFLIMINFIIYKTLIEDYFINMYFINFTEGFLITFYTIIFYFLAIRREDQNKYGDPFDFNYIRLFFSCIFQILINVLIKFIIYKFDEMHETLPYILQMYIDIIKNSFFDGVKKNKILYFIVLLVLCFLLVSNLLLYTEVIIVRFFGLEKKTKKHLELTTLDEISRIDD